MRITIRLCVVAGLCFLLPVEEIEASPMQDACRLMGVQQAWIAWRYPGTSWQQVHLSESGAAGTPNDFYALGSTSKLFVSHWLGEAVTQGKVRLTDRVALWRPELATADWNPTIEQVARHEAGLFNPIRSKTIQKRIMEEPLALWSDEELARFALAQGLENPGQGKFAYSNASTSLLVLILEKATGQTFEQWLGNLPGRKETRVLGAGPVPAPNPGGFRFARAGWPIGYGTVWTDVSQLSPAWAGAGGNVVSTPEEILLLGDYLFQERGLGKEFLDARARVVPTGDDDWKYGLHYSIHGDWEGHLGDVPGWSAAILRNSKSGLQVIVLCNLSNTREGKSPARILVDTLERALEKQELEH